MFHNGIKQVDDSKTGGRREGEGERGVKERGGGRSPIHLKLLTVEYSDCRFSKFFKESQSVSQLSLSKTKFKF